MRARNAEEVQDVSSDAVPEHDKPLFFFKVPKSRMEN